MRPWHCNWKNRNFVTLLLLLQYACLYNKRQIKNYTDRMLTWPSALHIIYDTDCQYDKNCTNSVGMCSWLVSDIKCLNISNLQCEFQRHFARFVKLGTYENQKKVKLNQISFHYLFWKIALRIRRSLFPEKRFVQRIKLKISCKPFCHHENLLVYWFQAHFSTNTEFSNSNRLAFIQFFVYTETE